MPPPSTPPPMSQEVVVEDYQNNMRDELDGAKWADKARAMMSNYHLRIQRQHMLETVLFAARHSNLTQKPPSPTYAHCQENVLAGGVLCSTSDLLGILRGLVDGCSYSLLPKV